MSQLSVCALTHILTCKTEKYREIWDDCAGPTKIAQRVKFCEHLLIALRARGSRVDFEMLGNSGLTSKITR
jgi:hypothetical protein